jgi:hypothetical protein
MADQISQDDLDLLWGKKSETEAKKAEKVNEETSPSSSGVSQADLDALWAGLGGIETKTESPPKEEAAPTNAISQADLDALWGALGSNGDSVPKTKEEPAAQGISQDDLNALWGGLAADEGAKAPTFSPEPIASSGPIGEHLSQDDIDRLLEEMLG